uniref:Uncharacterized protein n=1 Tax=Anopheles melas TaxID=34690 RepID=A0A182UDJ9_9DIPT
VGSGLPAKLHPLAQYLTALLAVLLLLLLLYHALLCNYHLIRTGSTDDLLPHQYLIIARPCVNRRSGRAGGKLWPWCARCPTRIARIHRADAHPATGRVRDRTANHLRPGVGRATVSRRHRALMAERTGRLRGMVHGVRVRHPFGRWANERIHAGVLTGRRFGQDVVRRLRLLRLRREGAERHAHRGATGTDDLALHLALLLHWQPARWHTHRVLEVARNRTGGSVHTDAHRANGRCHATLADR